MHWIALARSARWSIIAALTLMVLVTMIVGSAAGRQNPKQVSAAHTLVLPFDTSGPVLTVGTSALNVNCLSEELNIGVSAGQDGVVFTGAPSQTISLPSGQAELIAGTQFDVEPGTGRFIFLSTFAMIDGGGTAANGILSVLRDPQNSECIVTLQAAG